MPSRQVTFEQQHWPYRQAFAISREVLTGQHVVVVALTEDGVTGRGEASPNGRYGDTPESALAEIELLVPALRAGLQRDELQRVLPPGPARNAIDCALWDLDAKRAGVRAWRLAALAAPSPLLCSQSIGLDTPRAMAAIAAAAWSPLLKLKLGGDGDIERVQAVRAAAPQARLIVDANEAWNTEQLHSFPPLLAALGVELIEQPLPAGQDDALLDAQGPVPFGADESFHHAGDVERIRGRYQFANIKLDKTGGLTEALRARAAAEAAGLRVMVGCMGGTSLAMAPAVLVAAGVAIADLDGPQILARDCSPGLVYQHGRIAPFGAELWG